MSKISNVQKARRGKGARGRGESPVSFKLDEYRFELIAALAVVDGTNMAEQIRQAAECYATGRSSDPDLHNEVDRAVERFRDRLKGGVLEDGSASLAFAPAPPKRDVDTERSVSLRLPAVTLNYLTSLALLDEFTIADEMRAAVDLYLEQRRQDPDLEARIDEANRERDQLISRLQQTA